MAELNTHIPEIPYPPEYLEDLKGLMPKIMAGLERDGLPIDADIDLGKLVGREDVAYFFFIWTAECNGVIENLNIVLHDLRALPNTYAVLGGSADKRYKLLIRTFFHEFYRIREIFNTVMHACVERKFLPKEELSIVRKAFHTAIEDTISLRNSLVHGTVNWRGSDHFDLHLTSWALERNQQLVHRESSEVFSVGGALERTCSKAADLLLGEGKKVSELMGAFVHETVQIATTI